MRLLFILICLPLIFGCMRGNKKKIDDRKVLSIEAVPENEEKLYSEAPLIPIDNGERYDIWASRDERYNITADSLCGAEDTLFANKTRLRGQWEVVMDRHIASENHNPWHVAERFDIHDGIMTLVLVSDGRASDESCGWLVNYDAEGKCIDALKIFYEDDYSSLWPAFYFDCQSWEAPCVELLEKSRTTFTRQVVDVLGTGRFSGREIHEDSIQWVEQTCYIIPSPEVIHFDDEESPEAQDWFTVVDDWTWYGAQTREALNEIGLEEVYADKRYLGYKIANQSKIILDSRSPDISVIVFKVGQQPILADICTPEIVEIKKYLNDK